MSFFNDEVKKQLVAALAPMKERVTILYFTQEVECGICRDAHLFLDEFCALSEKVNLSVLDFVLEKDKAAYYGVDKIPAMVLLDKNDADTGIRFFGIPAGYEINSFLSALLDVSGALPPLPADIETRMKKIARNVHIEVFISVTCPHCPEAVIHAHKLALANPLIRADMIDSAIFTPLAIKNNVTGVPRIVINGGAADLTGAQPLSVIADAVEKAVQ